MTALIMESVYGHWITSLDDPYIAMIDREMDGVSSTGPAGSTMVDFFPLCESATPALRLGVSADRRGEGDSEARPGVVAGDGLEAARAACARRRRGGAAGAVRHGPGRCGG